MNICILGAGSMGTALGSVLETRKHNIMFWTIEKDVYEQFKTHKENKKYLPGIKFKNAKITMNIKDALQNIDIVIFSVPSHALRKVAEKIKGQLLKNIIIVNVAKGLEEKTNKRMSEILREYFNNPIVSVGGPSIAVEIAKKTPTFVVYACEDINIAKKIKKLFETKTYNIEVSKDIKGVELCGAFKNIIAIISGISDGLGYGVNTKSGLITQGLKELKTLGINKETLYNLAGLGDIVVTCMSKHSRNRTFGEKIGKGLSIENALKEMKQVVEGIKATKIIYDIIKKNNLNCPLIKKTYDILFNGEKVSI